MVWKTAACLGCLAPLTGCLMFQNAAHNLYHESVQLRDDTDLRNRLQDEAEDLWAEIARPYAEGTFTAEFIDGFIDGYVDYLDSGGNAAPPAVPPARYRTARYLSPEGHALIRDYFAGFKYGAEVACVSGKRQYLTVPVLLPLPAPKTGVKVVPSNNPPRERKSAAEVAPMPRELPPSAPPVPSPSDPPKGPELPAPRPETPPPGVSRATPQPLPKALPVSVAPVPAPVVVPPPAAVAPDVPTIPDVVVPVVPPPVPPPTSAPQPAAVPASAATTAAVTDPADLLPVLRPVTEPPAPAAAVPEPGR